MEESLLSGGARLFRQARLSDLDRILEIELENFSIEEAIPRSVFEAHLKEIKTSFLVAEKEGGDTRLYRRSGNPSSLFTRPVFH